ncbi:MAG: electron transport protein SCO1/SenC [Friedmanniella sp.]|nr:electron transport protein SCO1/SenC [Friedmanniella sp.]
MTPTAPAPTVPARGTALRTLVLLVVVTLVGLSGCTARPDATVSAAADPAGYLGGTSLPDPYEMPDRALTDTSGRAYNLATSPSKPVTLLFFGYTHCPDVCITVLSDVALALKRVDPAARDQIQMIFVTTDPARDDEKQIKAYLGRFNPDFIGLTGSLTSIKSVAGRVGVDIEGMTKLPSGGYDVGHSAQVIGFDRRAGEVIWTPGTSVGDLAHDFGLLVERSR